MKVPLFTQRTFLFFHTEDILFFTRRMIFIFHTEYHGISRRFLNIDYNSDNFSVTISEKKRKSVTVRDHPCEKKKNLRVKKENP